MNERPPLGAPMVWRDGWVWADMNLPDTLNTINTRMDALRSWFGNLQSQVTALSNRVAELERNAQQ